MNWEVLQEAIVILFQMPVLWLIVMMVALNLGFVGLLVLVLALRPLLKNFGG